MARKAANGQGSLMVTRKNGVKYYCVRYTNPITGKQTAKGTGARSQEEALAKWDKLKASMTMGTFVSVDKMTVDEYLTKWLERRKTDLEPGTYKQYEKYSRLYIRPHLGNAHLQDLRRIHCQDFASILVKEGLSAKYIHNIIGGLTAMLNDAVKDELIGKNPAENLNLPRIEKKQPVVMDDDTQMAFEKAVQDSPYRNIYLLALHTGMRISEVLGLQWQNVHMVTGEIVVASQLERKDRDTERQVKQTTKSHKRRSTYVPPYVVETILKPERLKQNTNKLKAGALWQNSDGLVFTREDGSPMPHRTVEHAFDRIKSEIGHPELTLHSLRKTYITNEELAGTDIKTISDSVGHSASSITLDIYTAASKKSKIAAANRRQAEHEKRNAE